MEKIHKYMGSWRGKPLYSDDEEEIIEMMEYFIGEQDKLKERHLEDMEVWRKFRSPLDEFVDKLI